VNSEEFPGEEIVLTEQELRDIDIRRNAAKVAVALAVILVLVIILRYLLGDQIEAAGGFLIDRFGILGMFTATLLMDTFMSPVSPDVILFISIAGGVNVFEAIGIVSLASIIGGNAGYLIGRFLGNREFVYKRIKPFERKGKYLMRKYGIWAVIVGAMTPIPFSMVCWTAGVLKMRYLRFFPGTLWRIPRFLLWYIVLSFGFNSV
jgi:membrane protein YqaA with SNARE-associated domain